MLNEKDGFNYPTKFFFDWVIFTEEILLFILIITSSIFKNSDILKYRNYLNKMVQHFLNVRHFLLCASVDLTCKVSFPVNGLHVRVNGVNTNFYHTPALGGEAAPKYSGTTAPE